MADKTRDIEAGSVFAFPYPFVREEVELFDEEGPVKHKTWCPGVRWANVYPDDSEAIADGVGEQIVCVVDVHKPGKYPTRVFYTREWKSPDGKTFGKRGLRIKTMDAFRRLVSGYRFAYRVERDIEAQRLQSDLHEALEDSTRSTRQRRRSTC